MNMELLGLDRFVDLFCASSQAAQLYKVNIPKHNNITRSLVGWQVMTLFIFLTPTKKTHSGRVIEYALMTKDENH